MPLTDEEHEQVMDKTPNDPAFRRALFFMLLAIGLIAGSAFLYAREARDDQRAADRRAEAAEERREAFAQDANFDRTRLAGQVDLLLNRQRRTDELLIALLAESDDPAIQRAFAELADVKTIEEIPADERTPNSGPAVAPKPAPSASRPSPRPTDTRPTTAPRPPVSSPAPTPTREPALLEAPVPLPIPCTSIICAGP